MLLTKHHTRHSRLQLTLLWFFIIVGMHIVTPTPGGVGLYLTPNIIAWLFFSWLVAISLWQVTKSKSLNFTTFHSTILCAIALLVIPMFYSNSSSLNAIPRLLTMTAGFILLLSLSQLNLSRQGKSNLLLLLLFGVFIEALIGFLQLFILVPFNIDLVGYTPIGVRPYGSFTQPNVMASFLVTGLAIVFYLLLPGKLVTSTQKNYLRFFSCCSFAFALLVIVLQSKTGYLAGLLLLGLFFPSIIKHRKRFKLPLMALISGTLLGIIILKSAMTVDRGAQLYQDKYRSDMYYVSAQLFTDNPIQGVGYGNFERRYREKHLSLMSANNELQPPMKNLRHPHNEILFWLSEGGIIVLFAFILFAYTYLRLFSHLPKQKILPLLALVTPLLIHSQTEFPFYHSVVHWFYFIVFIWLTLEASGCKKKHLSIIKHTGVIKVVILLTGILSSLFMLTTLHTSLQMERFKVSGNKDIELLNKVVNRLAWQEYFEVTLYSYYLNKGFTQKNEQALVAYIDWASAFVKQTPRKALYQNMIVAIKTLESNGIKLDSELKDGIYNEAITLYPSFIKAEESH